MYYRLLILLLFAIPIPPSQAQYLTLSEEILEALPEKGDPVFRRYISSNSLYLERWDTLSQPLFWRQVMNLSPELSFVNIASTRRILEIVMTDDYDALSSTQRSSFKDSIRQLHGIKTGTTLYVTSGKNEFYKFHSVLPDIDRAINHFLEVGTDPWYAQAILLIESPGRLQYSSKGAYGAFQLMRSVARANGLVVNKYTDERKDFDKSAKAAARLIKNTCIPHAKEMLSAKGIYYNETDLWFRLFVMHVYHAGAYNIKLVLETINPTHGDMHLIRTMWQTRTSRFRNSSQNYTQLVLASMMELEDIMASECDLICRPGD